MVNLNKSASNVNNTTNNSKEEITMNNTTNTSINLVSTHKNILSMVGTMMSHGQNYNVLAINGQKAICIGGKPKDVEANLEALQFAIDQAEGTPQDVVIQVAQLMRVMADLENVTIDEVVTINGTSYAIDYDNRALIDQMGSIVENMPELSAVPMDNKDIKTVLIYKAGKLPVSNFPKKDEMNITNTKLSVLQTIQGLRALGLKCSWYSIEGVRQAEPICYNGDGDKNEFTRVIQECLNNNLNPIETIITACKMGDENLSPDSLVEIVVKGCKFYFDEDTGNAYDESIEQVASIGEIDVPMVVKQRLIEKEIEDYLQSLDVLDEDYDDYEEDEYDWNDEDC